MLDVAAAVVDAAGAESGVVGVGGNASAAVVEGRAGVDRGVGNAGLYQLAVDVG